MPQANSTTSWPRLTSPSASDTTLPCSLVMILASSPLRALSRSRKANNTAERLANDLSRHAGKAAAAASITARPSSTLPNTTSPVTTPVAGLVTGAVAALVPGKTVLFIQWLIGGTAFSFAPRCSMTSPLSRLDWKSQSLRPVMPPPSLPGELSWLACRRQPEA